MLFSTRLLNWYQANKRELPWRKTKDPYNVWISEIILQQTRVNQGLPYYLSFIENFPNVQALSEASEQQVLRTWQGLGYYSRARNIHFTAKTIASNGGNFPTTYEALLNLKGIGTYTAAAISSICFGEAKAVIDGNVYRVLSRFYGIKDPVDTTAGQKLFSELANEVMDKNNPGDYNQSIMEFGALHCKPVNPDCDSCFLKSKCLAFKTNMVTVYPIKTKKIKHKNRYFNYILLTGDRGAFYQKRSKNDIWRNLYEPFLIESSKELNKTALLKSKHWLSLVGSNNNIKLVHANSIDHKLTHQTIKAKFWKAQIGSSKLSVKSRLKEFTKSEVTEIPLPRLIERYLQLGT